MPEIVEVDFLREEVGAAFAKHKVVEAALNNEKISNVTKDIFEKELVNEMLTSTDRVGKILILNFSNDKHLTIHFLLTGFMRLIDEKEKNKIPRHIFLLIMAKRLVYLALCRKDSCIFMWQKT